MVNVIVPGKRTEDITNPVPWYFEAEHKCHHCEAQWTLAPTAVRVGFISQLLTPTSVQYGKGGAHYEPFSADGDDIGGYYPYVVVWCPNCGKRQRTYR